MGPAIDVEGLKQLRKALKDADDTEAMVELRQGFRKATQLVADTAKARVRSRSGRAAASIRPVAGGNTAYVVGGRASVPYYGWLDFGSRRPKTGNPRHIGPWSGTGTGPKGGRFIYPAIDANEATIVNLVEAALDDALDNLGL